MYEVELKVRADHDTVREALYSHDAERVSRVEQVDTYYDAPHREFADTDEALRVRRETDLDSGLETAKLTYKGPLVDAESKTREEYETVVSDGEATAGLLDGLGFNPAATVEKERTSYEVTGFTVTLDAVDGLGTFVEVEREVVAEEADDPAVDRARNEAMALLEELGLHPESQIRTSYLGLLLESEASDEE